MVGAAGLEPAILYLGILEILGIFGIFGIFGIMLLPQELPRGKIGPEGVCEAYEGRRGGGKSFFAKRTKKSL